MNSQRRIDLKSKGYTSIMNKLTLEDKRVFDEAYSKLKYPLAEHSFSWVYLWDGCYKDIEWARINGNACLFLTFDGNRYLWGPILPGNKLKETMEKCFMICQNYNEKYNTEKNPAAMYIPEELKGKYLIDGFKVREQNQDYIYRRQDIIELRGDKYKSKRNLRNYFLKNYNHKVEAYNKDSHLKQCVELLGKWKKQKLMAVGGYKSSFDGEYNANLKALEHAEMLGLKGIVVYVNGKIEGYSFGEQTNNNMCTDFFEKTNLEIKGLSVFIYGELLKLFDGDYVNAGEDWGIDYLKKVKLSYNPCMIRKSYMVERCVL